MRKVQTDPTRRRSRESRIRAPDTLVLYWPSARTCACIGLVGGRHRCARRRRGRRQVVPGPWRAKRPWRYRLVHQCQYPLCSGSEYRPKVRQGLERHHGSRPCSVRKSSCGIGRHLRRVVSGRLSSVQAVCFANRLRVSCHRLVFTTPVCR